MGKVKLGTKPKKADIKKGLKKIKLKNKPKDSKSPDFSIEDNAEIQSSQLYIQAVGCKTRDRAKGNLLRWHFRNNLGDLHLAKGNYSKSEEGFNKRNDFINIYKIPYNNNTKNINYLRFNQQPLSISDDLYSWLYQGQDNNEAVQNKRTYLVKFLDRLKYDTTKTRINPNKLAFSFLQDYCAQGGLVEIELNEGLCFAINFNGIEGDNQSGINIETYTEDWDNGFKQEFISNRKTIHDNTAQILGENIGKLKLKINNKYVAQIGFEFYEDLLNKKNKISHLGAFALTLDDGVAFTRLESAHKFKSNLVWQNSNNSSTGDLSSYKSRWEGWKDMDGVERQGIKFGVQEYLKLSNSPTNPKAKKVIQEDKVGEENYSETKTVMEYLSLLQIVSSDYRVANKLGLGAVDTNLKSDNEKFIYLMEYFIPDQGSNIKHKQHLYMSLPTCIDDLRPPMEIHTLPIKYGLDRTGTHKICDENGYTPDGKSRFIRLYNKLVNDFDSNQSFFNPSTEFSLSEWTHVVFAGIEYRKENETNWRQPGIAKQVINEKTEALPLMFYEDAEKPCMIHKEFEEGKNAYASYPINIFSITGNLSNIENANETKFIIPNRLLAPSNLKIQLIQPESPLLLSNQVEQNALKYLTNQSADSLLLRVMFDYNHEQDINFQFAEEIAFLFRKEKQNVVKGKAVLSTDPTVLNTDTYVMNQLGIPNEVPEISIGQGDNFKAGVFTLNGDQFEVDQIVQEGIHPKVKIKPNYTSELVNDGNGNMALIESELFPSEDPEKLFMLEENLNTIDSWQGNVFNFKMKIQFPNESLQTETFTNAQGETVTRDLRGFWKQAVIIPYVYFDADLNSLITKKGYYKITFNGFQLPEHPDGVAIDTTLKSVNFFGGHVRIHEKNKTNEERKVLKVHGIEQNNPNLILLVQDESFVADKDTGLDIDIGNSLMVNYYPGYKLYLQKDLQADFIKDNVMPTSGYERQTIFTSYAKAQDPNSSDRNDIYYSYTAGPKVLSAEKIVSAERPVNIIGPHYATKPDLYGASTYTFQFESIRLDHIPYALVIYRTNLNAVLKALYEEETIRKVRDSLVHPYDDNDFVVKWNDLVNKKDLAFFNNGEEVIGNKFPFPNRLNKVVGNNTICSFGDYVNPNFDEIQKAIENSSFPILKEPLIYEKITQNQLSKNHPAIKLGSGKIRFTDYGLDGQKVDSYFYFVKEMSSKYELGEASEIIGPIQMIDTSSDTKPVIRKITSIENTIPSAEEASVKINILGYEKMDRIRKVRLYRSSEELNAASIRTMTLAKEIDIDELVSTGDYISIEDDFSDLIEIPYVDTLYYRLVVCRHIRYIKDNTINNNSEMPINDYVPSFPSKLLSAIVVDSSNPYTPRLEVENKILNNSGDKITSLKLSWNKTTYKGKYTLFKLNAKGNWNSVVIIESNNELDLWYEIDSPLTKVNDEGLEIYHRYKVDVLSTSGLMNRNDDVLVV